MAFSEVREYQAGDDVRDIDWNVTARFNRPYVKVYEEERELTVMLLIDVSGSQVFGTAVAYKRDMVAEIAATLAYSAIQNNDKIGVLMFSDRVERYIPPQKGRKHILYIISQLLDFKPQSNKTDIGQAIEFMMRTQRKSCTAFLISDFIDDSDYSKALDIMGRKHDVAAIQVYDRFMTALPDIGIMRLKDAETGHEQYIDTSDKRIREIHRRNWISNQQRLNERMLRSNIDLISVRTDENYVRALINMFAKRA